ncbi:MAG: transaldolase [Candidatus Margulisiibacteriota bacterium]
MSRLKDLHKFGQSPWYDNIERGLLLSGKLREMIDEDGIAGVTSNPTIFEKAINGSQMYDADLERFSKQGKDVQAIYDELTIWDIAKAAEVLLPTYTSSGKIDGFVSIEVSPHLAQDAAGTVAEAKRLYAKVGRANLLIKVPATLEGGEAIRQLIAQGVSVNATLIFSQAHYTTVAEAYIRGLEERAEKGLPVKGIHSVASFFVSRIDSYVDRMLNSMILKERDEQKMKDLESLAGKAAVAQAKVIYNTYIRIFYGPEFSKLKGKGANIQRLLFGSTSTKNPAYSDVKYVEEIIGEGTINTLPQATLDAFRDHGEARSVLGEGLAEAKAVLAKLQSYGILVEEVCQTIQDDGVQAFTTSYDKLIKSLENKRKKIIS